MKISFNPGKKSGVLIELVTKGKQGPNFGDFKCQDKNHFQFSLGEKEKIKDETYRRIASVIHDFCMKQKFKRINLKVAEDKIIPFMEGLLLNDYKFDKYKSEKDEFKVEEINFISKKRYDEKAEELKTIVNNVNLTRDLVNESSQVLTPEEFAKRGKQIAKELKLECEVLTEREIGKKGLNLIQTVGGSSKNQPRVLIIKYMPNKNGRIYGLVGKGITYDTGGYSLKPSNAMTDMKGDMGGAATILGAIKSIAELKMDKNVVAVIPLAENVISDRAYRPGEIFKSYNGKTVEIINTDAEGRLVLADALTLIQEYKPETVIDAATLTGSIIVALGNKLIGMFGNDEEVQEKIFQIGERTYERAWKMPIYEEHEESLKSEFADLKNVGNKVGDASNAAAFLKSFVREKTKWAHLDLAAAALSEKRDYYWPTLGTGKGVRLLVEYFKNV